MNLIAACGIAFLAVFLLLMLLAGLMKLITAVFPVRDASVDPTVVAAVYSAVAVLYPGSKVTTMKEKS